MKVCLLATVSALLVITSNSVMAGCTPNVNGSTGNNTCIGSDTLSLNISTSINNTAVGANALNKTTAGTANSAFGFQSLFNNTTGTQNVAIGNQSIMLGTTVSQNVAVGYQSLSSLTTGTSNIAIGVTAGSFLTIGSNNVYIANPGPLNATSSESSIIRIGMPSTHQMTYIAGIRNQNVTGGVPVLVSSTGQLGVATSSRRYKEDINTLGNVDDELQKLRPVTFRYKQANEEGKKPLQYGLIAEEVDAVMPQLVTRNQNGSPETVAYQYLPTLLLGEYQKDHKKLVEAEKIIHSNSQLISELKSEIDELKKITRKLAQGSSNKHKTASLQ